MEKINLDTLLEEKIDNFRIFLEDKILKYVGDDKRENAEINIGMFGLPYFAIKAGMRSVFVVDRPTIDIINEIANDYFVDMKDLSTEESLTLKLYCEFFKKYLNM